jgi:hypothetical protein
VVHQRASTVDVSPSDESPDSACGAVPGERSKTFLKIQSPGHYVRRETSDLNLGAQMELGHLGDRAGNSGQRHDLDVQLLGIAMMAFAAAGCVLERSLIPSEAFGAR